jgi:hypothetical protein
VSILHGLGSFDPDTVAPVLLLKVMEGIPVTHIRLLLEGLETGGDFQTRYVYPVKPNVDLKSDFKLNVDNPICVWLDKNNIPLHIQQSNQIQEIKGLWQSEKEEITRAELDLMCPLTGHGCLIGILALGEKKANTPFTQKEIEFIYGIFNKAATTAFENERLYRRAKEFLATWDTSSTEYSNCVRLFLAMRENLF